MKRAKWAVLGMTVFLFSGCGEIDRRIYTLYRTTPADPLTRIHVATFDVDLQPATYNRENCPIAAGIFASQPGVSVRYWCEQGRYRPSFSN